MLVDFVMCFYCVFRSQSRVAGARSAFFTPYGGSIYRGQEKRSINFRTFVKIFSLESPGLYLNSEFIFEEINIAFLIPFRFISVEFCDAQWSL